MSMLRASSPSLWHHLGAPEDLAGRWMRDAHRIFALPDLATGSVLGNVLEQARGRSIVVATRDQMATVLAMIELDGVAARLVLCPPDVLDRHAEAILDAASIDLAITDDAMHTHVTARVNCPVICQTDLAPIGNHVRPLMSDTEWVLLTSGTTGAPKLVAHTLASLLGPIGPVNRPSTSPVWSTFYDIRRYGGLQIILRALTGGGSMILSDPDESPEAFATRAGAADVTNISGTPSHWRRAAMARLANRMNPGYIRLSGEIADQSILDQLHTLFPSARIVHAFASTEAGVAFEVTDRTAGFPKSLVDQPSPLVDLAIEDGTIRIRSQRTASHYLGRDTAPLRGPDGFVNTGDRVELHGERYYFIGRQDGVINVGGLKVHPEEVEAVINRHPDIQMSRARSQKNPITGAVVVADVVPTTVFLGRSDKAASAILRHEIVQLCREALPVHKVPAIIRFVDGLAITPAGKVARDGA